MPSSESTVRVERRARLRAPVCTHVDYFADGAVAAGESIDLSAGGMLLRTERPFDVGAELRLRFTPPDASRSLFVAARVARLVADPHDPAHGTAVGVEFVDTLDETVAALDRLTHALAGRIPGRDVHPAYGGHDAVPRAASEHALADEHAADERVDPLASDETGADEPIALGAPPPEPAVHEGAAAAAPRAFSLTFATPEDFLDAYVEHLSSNRLVVPASEPLPAGTPVEVELGLPNYYEKIGLAGEVASRAWAGRWGALPDTLVIRLAGADSDELAFVHEFARVYLRARTAGLGGPSHEELPAAPSPPVVAEDAELGAAPAVWVAERAEAAEAAEPGFDPTALDAEVEIGDPLDTTGTEVHEYEAAALAAEAPDPVSGRPDVVGEYDLDDLLAGPTAGDEPEDPSATGGEPREPPWRT